MNAQIESPRRPARLPLLLAVVAVVAVAVVFALVSRRGQAPAEPETGFNLEAYLERAARWDAEKGFDYAAHEEALHAVGPAHHATMAEVAEAVAALRAREAVLADSHPELDALSGELQDLRVRIEAQVEAQAPTVPQDAEPPSDGDSDAPDPLQDELDAKQAALWKLLEGDPEWKALHVAFKTAEARRDEARKRLHAVIRTRMKAEHEIAQAKRQAGAQEVSP